MRLLPFLHLNSIDKLWLSNKFMIVAIKKIEWTHTILKAIFPLAFIYLSSGPHHFAKALSEIVFKLAVVNIAIRPSILSFSSSPIIMVLSLILIMSGTIFPKPCTFLHPINKLANVIILVSPKVFTITAHLIKRERSLVNVPAQVFEAPCSFLNANVRVFFRWVVNIRLAKIVLRVMNNFCLRQKVMETTWGVL